MGVRKAARNPALVMESMISIPSSVEESVDESSKSHSIDVSVPDIPAPLVSSQSKKKDLFAVRSKFLIFVILVSVTAACASITFLGFRKLDDDSFETVFAEYADAVAGVASLHAQNVYASVEQLATAMDAYAADSDQQFPFVTIPDFEYRTQQIFSLTDATYVQFQVFVEESERLQWQNYSVANQGWVQDGLDAQHFQDPSSPELTANDITSYIHRGGSPANADPGPGDPHYAVTWQSAPAMKNPTSVNYNVRRGVFKEIADYVYETKLEAISTVVSPPLSLFAYPVIPTTSGDDEVVGIIATMQSWLPYFENILPKGVGPFHVVMNNSCTQTFTLEIYGPTVTVINPSADVHDSEFTEYGGHYDFSFDPSSPAAAGDGRFICTYSYSVYPTGAFQKSFHSPIPILSTSGLVVMFVITAVVFMAYDMIVTRRHNRIAREAARAEALLSSLFPTNVRERLIQQHQNPEEEKERAHLSTGQLLIEGLQEKHDGKDVKARLLQSKPIADLFTNASVMFADIAGFTAWSSVREPSQVFTLLEQVYNNFDVIARKRRIFKVETIGDCYVAAAGLPDPRPDHAVALCRFANECLHKMNTVVRKLEVRLGPETGELCMRIGIHSGPITAGVLRGEKSRFQLFGDTVNTASAIESAGARNRVHLSAETAKILIQVGRGAWVEKREDLVTVKGKGEVETYWLTLTAAEHQGGSGRDGDKEQAQVETSSASESGSDDSGDIMRSTSEAHDDAQVRALERKKRLIDWNVDVLLRLLKKIMAMRSHDEADRSTVDEKRLSVTLAQGATVLDEAKEIIRLPQKEMEYKRNHEEIDVGDNIAKQLQNYVMTIASMYRNNSFHNFEHASHVIQSVTKLMSRIVKNEDIDYNDLQYKKKGDLDKLHQYTYGITSDPITQFACTFSALIHDVDHSGVPNATLVKEKSEVATTYKNKSVAEQNSVDIAWSLLMEDQFRELRAAIYTTQDELERFRQLVVNSVMATDIADKELGHLRRARWAKAFADSDEIENEGDDEFHLENTNRKATIVIEHLIQASDVSHTMQHWHVYIKWNEKFFREMYQAYEDGRMETNPADGWYKGELGFFDFYIIPLAKKLKECGVFGVSSDEYLDYAQANRQEWEQKGEDLVKQYLSKYERIDTKPSSLRQIRRELSRRHM